MRASALDGVSWRDTGVLVLAIVLSTVAHVAGAAGATRIPPRAPEPPVWVEVAVQVTEPPTPEPTPPEPEPPAPAPAPTPRPKPVAPEVIEHSQTADEPPPTPQPEAKPVVRQVQGLDNQSFLQGGQTNLTARAGNTTATKAGTETMRLDEATEFVAVPYTSIGTPPKIRFQPKLEIPAAVIELQLEGRVEAVLTVGPDGTVSAVTVVTGLHPEADAACVRSLQTSRWKPGTKDGAPVGVTSVPYSCRFKMSVD